MAVNVRARHAKGVRAGTLLTPLQGVGAQQSPRGLAPPMPCHAMTSIIEAHVSTRGGLAQTTRRVEAHPTLVGARRVRRRACHACVDAHPSEAHVGLADVHESMLARGMSSAPSPRATMCLRRRTPEAPVGMSSTSPTRHDVHASTLARGSRGCVDSVGRMPRRADVDARPRLSGPRRRPWLRASTTCMHRH